MPTVQMAINDKISLFNLLNFLTIRKQPLRAVKVENMHPNMTLLEQQKDLSGVTPVDSSHSVYRVQQTLADDLQMNRLVKVFPNAQNFYSLKLQKQFLADNSDEKSIAKLVQVRKVSMHYLFIFEDAGKQNLMTKVSKKGAFSGKKAKSLLLTGVQVLKKLQTQQKRHSRIQPSHWVLKKKAVQLVGWHHLQAADSSYEQERLPNDYESLLYKAPESWDGVASIASEIYSLGLCLYFALTGKHLVEALWCETKGLHKQLGVDDYQQASKKRYFLPLSKRPTAWQMGWLKQSLSFPASIKLKTTWENLLRWMLDPNPQNRPTVEQLEIWLQDKQIIQSAVLAKVEMPSVPESWQDSAIKTAMADAHKLLAIFDNAKTAYKAGEVDYAFNLFENCVFKKHSQSEVMLGKMYERGEPVSQSYALAATMYYQAFCKGNPEGAFLLANLLYHAKGVPQNSGHAEILFRFAAMRGVLAAQVALGELYAQSQNSLTLARFWLVLAVQNGAIEAQAMLSKVLEELLALHPQEVEQASSARINLLNQEMENSELTLKNNDESLLPLSELINPEKVLQSAQGLEARMERLIDQMPL